MRAIFAMDSKFGIGKEGTLPDFPNQRADLRWFKEMTMGKNVIMGRKTWEDPRMPKPLAGRHSTVITRQPPIQEYEYTTFSTELVQDKNSIVIGGASIIQQYLQNDLLTELFITFHKGDYKCDTNLDFEQIKERFQLKNIIYRKYDGQEIYVNYMERK